MGLANKDEMIDLFKVLDIAIRDVKLKLTTLRRAEKRESSSTSGGSGGSSIGRAIGKVLHRKSKSEVWEWFFVCSKKRG